MSLREMGPQLKLPFNVTKGSMPSQSSSDEGFDRFSPLKPNIQSIFCFRFFSYKHSKQWPPKCIVEIVLINNLGFKVLIVNSGTKYDFKYEKRR